MLKDTLQLSTILNHGDQKAILKEVVSILIECYGKKTAQAVSKIFKTTVQTFEGKFKGYQACNTDYHDLQHTLDVLVATVRILDGYRLAGYTFTPEEGFDVCAAALLHDIGYLLETQDIGGTGAKYTATHVKRGVAFLEKNYRKWNIPAERIPRVSRLIWGTDLAKKWDELGFVDPTEKTLAAILATGDLLGQMGDRAYLEKLLFLYYEFREAGFEGYKTAFDILKSTQGFYQIMRVRMETVLEGACEKATLHFLHRYASPINLYLQSIERQLVYLAGILEDESTNFRKKLKRMDLETAEPRMHA